MEPRSIKDSTVTISFLSQAQDANLAGNVHGWIIMKHIDEAGGMTSLRHCKGNVVTASIDPDFYIQKHNFRITFQI